MNKRKIYLICLALGIITSLVSGLYTQDLTKGAGALITGYGFPLPWLEKTTVVVPGSPSSYSLSWYGFGLLVDIVSWFLLIGIAYVFYNRFTK